MKVVQLSPARLGELTARFGQCRVAVIGDFFLDKYLDIDPALAETSVETGLTAHQVVSVRCSPGAAGTIVCNLAALGTGSLHAIGFTGDDGEAFDLRKELARLSCRTEHLHIVSDRHTPTYLKPRDAHTASLRAEHPRYDTKNRLRTSTRVEESIIQSLRESADRVDAVIVLDQVEEADCGAVTQRVREALAQLAREKSRVVFWADSRRRIREFSRVIIKPNQFEAVGKCNPVPGEEVPPEQLREAAEKLCERSGAPVVVTRGAAGMLVSHPEWTLVPGVRVEGEIDPTGAGDSATAGAVLALCAGATLPEAALIGNLVASITVQQIGTTGVARSDQLAEQLERWQQQVQGSGH
jgi:rfaE bifunctional protein kinase chain/domain